MKKIVSIIKAIGMTAFMFAVILKSLFFLYVFKESIFGSNPLLVIGVMLLALSYFLSSFKSDEGRSKSAFNLLFCIFLIGSLFMLFFWQGSRLMLLIVISLIPILIFMLLPKKNSQISNPFTYEDLLWIIAILFGMTVYFITLILHLNTVIVQHINL
jgi:hypothetical protein